MASQESISPADYKVILRRRALARQDQLQRLNHIVADSSMGRKEGPCQMKNSMLPQDQTLLLTEAGGECRKVGKLQGPLCSHDKNSQILGEGDRNGDDCRETWNSRLIARHEESRCSVNDVDMPGMSNTLSEVLHIPNWSRQPGETSISHAVRLYFFHLDGSASHEDNCKNVLREILEHVAVEELDVPTLRMRHLIKIEAFLRATTLCVPHQPHQSCQSCQSWQSWQQYVRGALSTPPAMDTKTKVWQQISKAELEFRIGLFVGMLRAERQGKEEVDAALDSIRVEVLVRGYTANAREILPMQRPARTILPPLLFCMACELLTVRMLGPEVSLVCVVVVSDYEARAKLWMNPLQNSDQYLRPLAHEFVTWLRQNRGMLYQSSATEGLLRSIDRELRTTLKGQVYESPHHFLLVLRSLKDRLTDMPLPSYNPSCGDEDHPFNVTQVHASVVWCEYHT
ncbi:unnamed protein product [Choristocarpus tenellus]